MPHFYFDLNDGREVRDNRGMKVSGLDEARARAVQMVGAHLQGSNPVPTSGGAITVDARDNAGNHILTARAVLTIDGR